MTKTNTFSRIFGALAMISSIVIISALSLSSFNVHAQADTEPPAADGVEGVEVKEVGDGSVTLTWDVATDNVGVTGYNIYYGTESVTEDNEAKYQEKVDAGNVITYEVDKLQNETKYYFAVTAYDAAGNESESYSEEVSGTPNAGAQSADENDTTSPTVALATASGNTKVKVVFSEAVKLPSTNPESAFSIKDAISETILAITGAEIDTEDTSKKTVILTTGKQKEGTKYELTAGIAVTDLNNNPIKSGTSDTAVFVGRAEEAESTKPAADEKQFELTKVNVFDDKGIEVVFNEEVRLGIDPLKNFIITEKADSGKQLKINEVILNRNDKRKVLLRTEPQSDLAYIVIARDVTDSEGTLINLDKNSAEFQGKVATEDDKTEDPKNEDDKTADDSDGKTEDDKTEDDLVANAGDTVRDTTPPENISNLVAQLMGDMVVRLSWLGSLDTGKDLVDQMLYISTDGGKTYDKGRSIGATASKFDLKGLKAETTYHFKVTAKDKAGNENTGIITTLGLPATGPFGLAALAFGSLGTAYGLQRRKRKVRK